MSLSDAAIRCVKSKNQEFKLFDEGGLYLLIKPSGSKLWRFKYRIHGKDRALALGSYPATSLKAARKARDEARELLEKGGDPGTEKKRQAVAASIAAASTFNLVAEEYVQKLRDDGMAPATEKKTLWLLKQFADNLGPRPISDIEAFEVLHMLRKVEKKGNLETAHRLRSFAGRVFRYAIWTSRANTDPTAMLAGALRTPKVTNHAAIVEAKPLGGLLRAIDGFEGYKPIGYALKLSPHVFVRPSELRRAEWTEFNLDEAYWRIPANRMKMGREHWVPLSRQSVTLLLDLNEITGNHVYLFPSIRTWQRPMSENAVNVALRRLGYGPDEMTGHGFRSTASTLLNESGLWQPDAIEVALVHKDKNKVRGTYNRGRYWSERVEMAQWWSDHPYAHGWGRVYPQTVPLSPEAAEQLQTKQQALEDLLVPFEGADELPDEIDQAAGVLEAEIATLEAPQDVYDPQDIARGGVFVTLLSDGGAAIHRGLIRPEDALPEPETPEPETEDFAAHPDDAPEDRVGEEEAEGAGLHTEDTEDASEAAPVSDLLLRDLTTHWTLALRYTLAEQPELAARYLVHRLALDTFYRQRSVTCLDITARSASIESFAEGLDDSPTAAALAARHEAWAAGLPDNPADLWPHLLTLNAETLGSLMAHCTVLTVFAVRQAYMPAAPYVASLMMARDLRLNMTDHWTPTARSYFSRVTKGQILAAVREAVGDEAARRLHKLKKPEMAEAAEQLVQGTGWLPACLRTPAPPEETAQAPLALPLSEPTPDLPEAAE